jgi:tagatose-6-phosphate ketose/aldose isomerase
MSAAEKEKLGIQYTPAEIAQQPEVWRETALIMAGEAGKVATFLRRAGIPGSQAEIIFAGAGSSDFVGRSVCGFLTERLGTRALACATTDIVSHPDLVLPKNPVGIMVAKDRAGMLVSIARSGNSPESVAAVEIALEERPELLHLIITCNPEGKLAQLAAQHSDRMLALVLPQRTNDQGLAMTSSFTSMTIASQMLGFLGNPTIYMEQVDRLAQAAEQMLAQGPAIAKAAIALDPPRACFLGSGTLLGCATEAHLKLQELTDGELICLCDSFLGIRHGPQAAIRQEALVIYMMSSDPYARRYEIDLLREQRAKKLGRRHIVIMDKATTEVKALADDIIELDPTGSLQIPDALRPPVDVIIGQLLGLFASLSNGLKPDAPSRAGIISRVVKGVVIYPRPTAGFQS